MNNYCYKVSLSLNDLNYPLVLHAWPYYNTLSQLQKLLHLKSPQKLLSDDTHIVFCVQISINKHKNLLLYFSRFFNSFFHFYQIFINIPIRIRDSYRSPMGVGGECKVLKKNRKLNGFATVTGVLCLGSKVHELSFIGLKT